MVKIAKHKLKNYLNRPDGELDLHGFTKTESLVALSDFLNNAHQLNWQRVRIITGKGINSPGGKFVIREVVMEWLRNQNYRFSFAKSKEGGAGSIIVEIN
jgi:DNA-nicking Smr family endonuclease